MINNCIKLIQSLRFPQSCLLCSQVISNRAAICDHCESTLPLNQPSCFVCANPLFGQTNLLCPKCQKQPPAYDNSFIPFRYEKPLEQLIHQFKFHGNLVTGKLLVDLFVKNQLAQQKDLPEVLIPVPLHPSRIRLRGFNQALWLAEQISKQIHIPVDNRVLKRTIKTAPQHELGYRQRMTNLNNAFDLKKTCDYQHVAIVDDVVTTGSTINTIAKLIKDNSNTQIQAWAIARTGLT